MGGWHRTPTALAGGVWLIVRWRDRQLRARALALERQIRERTHALRTDLGNTIGSRLQVCDQLSMTRRAVS